MNYSESKDLLPIEFEVVARGTGPVIGLAHAVGADIEQNFAPLLAAFSDRRRFVGLNLPGSGASPARESIRLEEAADSLVAAIRVDTDEPVPLVGYSVGAAIALMAAHRHPDAVSSLVLTVGFAHADNQLRSVTRVISALGRAGERQALGNVLALATGSTALLGALPADEYDAMAAHWGEGFPAGAVSQADLAGSVEVRDLLPTISVPVLVVVAGDDRIVLPQTTRELAAALPSADVVELKDSGHLIVGADADRWADEVGRFLGL